MQRYGIDSDVAQKKDFHVDMGFTSFLFFRGDVAISCVRICVGSK